MPTGMLGPLTPHQRRTRAYEVREHAAMHFKNLPLPAHQNNGDEDRYAKENHYASYSKGLKHNPNGEVDPASYQSLLKALTSGLHDDFEAIQLGGPATTNYLLTNPQAGLSFDLEGADAHALTLQPCYRFDSAGEIGEIAENYWLALCRDVPFSDYKDDVTIAQAVEDLNKYAQFDGPRNASGKVDYTTLFRGNAAGALAGPYLSQFIITDVPYGAQTIPARIAFGLPAFTDYMKNETDYLAVQNGHKPIVAVQQISDPKIIFSGRDLGNYVHIDELFQAYLNACLLLITPQKRKGFGAPVSDGNPYAHSKTQVGFGTLGEPNFKVLVAEVATRAIKTVWAQKWLVHRRLRPEVFAARLHWHLEGGRFYDFDKPELAKLKAGPLNHPAIQKAHYFLPMAFPEGCPTHPAYGAGHATVAGACVTILKVLFNEKAKLVDLGVTPMEPDSTGTALRPYTGADAGDLTVGGELDKLAANVGIARNFAGVHWRSDFTASVELGEQVAKHFLDDYVRTYHEKVTFTWTTMDGKTQSAHN